MNFKNISDARISMLNNNPENLKNIISKLDPNLEVINNNDRTIFVKGYNDINSGTVIFDNAINELAGNNLNCNPAMVYNVFPLSNDSCLIKI